MTATVKKKEKAYKNFYVGKYVFVHDMCLFVFFYRHRRYSRFAFIMLMYSFSWKHFTCKAGKTIRKHKTFFCFLNKTCRRIFDKSLSRLDIRLLVCTRRHFPLTQTEGRKSFSTEEAVKQTHYAEGSHCLWLLQSMQPSN